MQKIRFLQWICLIAIIFSGEILWAQKNGSSQKIHVSVGEKDQQICVIYTIESGTTLFSLSKKSLDIPVQSILSFNPNLDKRYEVGAKVYIPIDWIKNWSKIQVFHKVKAQETLYALAKFYQIELEKLKKANHIKSDTIGVGIDLWIPMDEKTAKKMQNNPMAIPSAGNTVPKSEIVLIEHVVRAEETLYSIAKKYEVDLYQLKKINNIKDNFKIHPHEILFIPVSTKNGLIIKDSAIPKSITEENIKPEVKLGWENIPLQQAKISLILPLDLELNKKFTADPRNKNKKVYEVTENALKFYAGIQMALDSLSNQNIQYQLQLIDGYETEKLIKNDFSNVLKKSDLFIVAMDSSYLKTWMDSLSMYQKPIFLAAYQNSFTPQISDFLNQKAEENKEEKTEEKTEENKIELNKKTNNTKIFSIYHHDTIQLNFIQNYLQKYGKNDRKIYISNALNKTQHQELVERLKNQDSTQIVVSYPNIDWENNLVNHLSIEHRNLLIFPEKDLVVVSRFLTDFQRLRNQGFRDYQFSILGFETWSAPSDHIEEELKFELNYQFVTSKFLNLEKPETREFLTKFYKKNNADAEEIGLMAYDLFMQIHQKIYSTEKNITPYSPIFLNFSIDQKENNLFILEYNRKKLKLQTLTLD